MMEDKRLFSPATARNRHAILECLQAHLPNKGTLLEVASGSGEHGHFLSPFFPNLKWQPSDFQETNLHSIRAWGEFEPRDNFLPPIFLDSTAQKWDVEGDAYPHGSITALFNANMIHISPWAVCQGLMAGAGRILPKGGFLFLYGPFRINGEQTAPSNARFEKWLTDQNPEFGVRDIAAVTTEANKNGLQLLKSLPMPSNNFIQIFTKQ